MRYALMIHYPQPAPAAVTPEQMQQGMMAFQQFAKAMDDAGVLKSAEVLQTTESATSVKVRDGAMKVQDGPFAATTESFAGIFMIEVPDLDAALAWAERCPAAYWGTVELRPSAKAFVDGQWVSTN